ncbi:MAG: hypothetical protein UE295_08070 [Acutalibacteraceae bacterium]|nr:hypothetical protein [Acutalibacteraceae bacterium]
MDNNFNNQSNNSFNGFGTIPDNNFNTNQNNIQNNTNEWQDILNTPIQQTTGQTAPDFNSSNSNADFNPNANYLGNQQQFNPNANYMGNQQSFNPNTDYSGNQQSFNSNTDYSGNQQSFNPNTNYSGNQSDFAYNQNNNNYFSNQAFNNNPNMYPNQAIQPDKDPNKAKAVSSLAIGITGFTIALINTIVLLISMLLVFPLVLWIIFYPILLFIATVLGIIGIVFSATYFKKSRLINVYTNKGKATAGMVFSIIAIAVSIMSTISCFAYL